MEIRNNLDALRNLLGVTASSDPKPSVRNVESSPTELGGDQATLSAGAAAISRADGSGDVRMDKVAAVQAAIAGGTYSVPASAVAGKMMDAMLADGVAPGVKAN